MAVGGINGINTVSLPNSVGLNKISEDESKSINFSDFLLNAMSQVSELENQADTMSEDFAAGKIDNVHDVTIAAEKADLALQYTLQIRNKVLDAYSEIMRMQI